MYGLIAGIEDRNAASVGIAEVKTSDGNVGEDLVEILNIIYDKK